MKNPVMLFMVLAIVLSGAAGICTSLAALFHHLPTANDRDTPIAPAEPAARSGTAQRGN